MMQIFQKLFTQNHQNSAFLRPSFGGLVGLFLLLTSLSFAQTKKFKVRYSSSESRTFNIIERVTHLNNRGKEVQNRFDTRDGIHVYNANSAVFRLTLEDPNADKNTFPQRITIKANSSGCFSPLANSNLDLKFSKEGNKQTRDRDFQIPIQKSGKGTITINVESLNYKVFGTASDLEVEGRNSEVAFTFKVVFFEEEYKRLLIEAQKRNYKVAIPGLAALYDRFAFYQTDPDMRKTAHADQVRKDRTAIRDKIKEWEQQLWARTQEGTNLDETFIYQDAIGNGNSTLTEPFKKKADQAIEGALKTAYTAIEADDIQGYEAFYRKVTAKGSKIPPNYAPAAINNRIKSLVDTWYNNRNVNILFCKIWVEIQGSDFYTSNKNKNNEYSGYFKEADEICNPTVEETTCSDIIRFAKRARNTTQLNNLLVDCKELGCGTDCEVLIKKRINEVVCDRKWNLARNETNIEEKRSLLNSIKNECGGKWARDAAALLEQLVAPEIEIKNIGMRKDTTPYYLVEGNVIKGVGVKVVLIDSISSDSTTAMDLLRSKIQYRWVKADEKIQFLLFDDEDHEVVIESQTGERQSIVLSKDEFELIKVTDINDLIEVETKNGRSPIWASFEQDNKKFFLQVKDGKIGVKKSDIEQFFEGPFKLKLKSKNGQEVDGDTINFATIKRAEGGNLWIYLLAPVLLLAGFLVYRNLLTKINR